MSQLYNTELSSLAVTVSSGGNVGIGTGSPPYRLTIGSIWDNLGANYVAAFGGDLAIGGFLTRAAHIRITEGKTGTYLFAGKDSVKSEIFDSQANPLYLQRTGGNVGIGLLHPSARLHVFNDSSGDGKAAIQVDRTASEYEAGIWWGDKGQQKWFIGMDNNKEELGFWSSIGNKWTFIMDGVSGNIGIGTTNPTARLQINSESGSYHSSPTLLVRDINQRGTLVLESLLDKPNDFVLKNNNRLSWSMTSRASGQNYALQFYSSSNGTSFTIPVLTLNTDGSAIFSGGVTASGSALISDRRFKTSIHKIDSSLEKVFALNGVTYDWDTLSNPERHFPAGRQIGMIAQDVEKILPEVVHTDGQGYKSLSYDKLTAVLVEGMKEQQKIIDSLKVSSRQNQREVEELRAELQEIRAMISAQADK